MDGPSSYGQARAMRNFVVRLIHLTRSSFVFVGCGLVSIGQLYCGHTKYPQKHLIIEPETPAAYTVFWEQLPERRKFSFLFPFFLACVAAQWTVVARWTTTELPITIPPKHVWATFLHLVVSAR